MSIISYRRKSRRVYVYYYDKKAGRQVQVPRDLTKHLDGHPTESVEAWVAEWERENGMVRARIERMVVRPNSMLSGLLLSYRKHRDIMGGVTQQTLDSESSVIERYITVYFVRTHRQHDPKTWHAFVPGFYTYLTEQPTIKGLDTIKKILWTLERFGKYLVYVQHSPYPFVVQIPKRNNRKITPLKTRATPEQVKAAARSIGRTHPKAHMGLAVLLGYFASLASEELFALTKEDILTGNQAREKTSGVRSGLLKHGLGSSMGVRINKALKGASNTDSYPKNSYRYGVVNVWDPDAAKQIAAILKELPPGRLFQLSRGYLEPLWRKHVKPILGLTPHDCRRASCLYLGRTIRLEPTLLQEHARHSELTTTMLYCRAPKVMEDIDIEGQDLDDVG